MPLISGTTIEILPFYPRAFDREPEQEIEYSYPVAMHRAINFCEQRRPLLNTPIRKYTFPIVVKTKASPLIASIDKGLGYPFAIPLCAFAYSLSATLAAGATTLTTNEAWCNNMSWAKYFFLFNTQASTTYDVKKVSIAASSTKTLTFSATTNIWNASTTAVIPGIIAYFDSITLGKQAAGNVEYILSFTENLNV